MEQMPTGCVLFFNVTLETRSDMPGRCLPLAGKGRVVENLCCAGTPELHALGFPY